MEENMSEKETDGTSLSSVGVDITLDSLKTEDIINQDILNDESKVKNEVMSQEDIAKHDIKTEIDDMCVTGLNGYVIKDYIKIEVDDAMNQEVVSVNDTTIDCTEHVSSCHGDNEIPLKCENDGDTKSECAKDDMRRDGVFISEDYCSADALPLAAPRQTAAGAQEEIEAPGDKLDTRDNPNAVDGLLVNKLSSDTRPYQNDCAFESSNNFKARGITACYMCNTCNYETNLKNNLVKHVKNHSGEKPFSCKLCNKTFIRRYNLKIHMRTHSSDNHLSCKLCNKSFNRKHTLKTHMTIHFVKKPFPCKLCNKSFMHKRSLKKHNLTHAGENPFSCQLCNKTFVYKYSHTVHVRMKHSAEKPFWCNLCNRAFNYNSNFTAHMKTHTIEKPLFCKFCNKVFKSKSCLKKHNIRMINSDRFSSKTCDIDHLIIRREESEEKNLGGEKLRSKNKCLNTRDRNPSVSGKTTTKNNEKNIENQVHSKPIVVKRMGIDVEGDILSATKGKRQSVAVVSRLRRGGDMVRVVGVSHSGISGLSTTPRQADERLAEQNRLFHKTREKARAQCWRYVWTQNGRVYARQDTDSPVQRIRTDSDIDKIFNSNKDIL